jgi:aspartyl-tRNA(Asn)/glutamyl-tRNA(Gln) amidotransferase subunit A
VNYLFSSIQQLKEKIRNKSLSPQELSDRLTSRCNSVQEKYNAFISIDPDVISKEIAVLFENIEDILHKTDNLPLTGLAGFTYALGDNIATNCYATTCASKMLSSYSPPFDAHVFSKLKESSAIITGKTNMEEFGIGCSGNSSFFKGVKNPWNTKHTAGSGAAAAALTGAANISFASDARGELRQAASYCGVFALKPTYGRISRRGLLDYASSLETIGLMARNTLDLATALAAVAGNDPHDVTALRSEVPDYISLIKENDGSLQVAVPENWQDAPHIEDEMKDIFQDQLKKLKTTGVKVDFIRLPHFQYSSLAATIISAVEAFSNLANYDGVRFGYRSKGKHLQEMYTQTRSEGFSSKLKKFLTFGALISSPKYYNDYFLKAQKLRIVISDELNNCLQKYDLLLTPTTPFKAPEFERDINQRQEGLPDPAGYYTAATNLAGLPSLSFPLHTNGLPYGLQLIGKKEDEVTLLRAALLLEKENTLAWPKFDF